MLSGQSSNATQHPVWRPLRGSPAQLRFVLVVLCVCARARLPVAPPASPPLLSSGPMTMAMALLPASTAALLGVTARGGGPGVGPLWLGGALGAEAGRALAAVAAATATAAPSVGAALAADAAAGAVASRGPRLPVVLLSAVFSPLFLLVFSVRLLLVAAWCLLFLGIERGHEAAGTLPGGAQR